VVAAPYPVNSDMDMVKMAIRGLEKIFRKGYQYKKAGVVALSITPDAERQLNIFEEDNARYKQVMKAVDHLNRELGAGKVKLAVQDLDRRWKMNQDHLSKRYTTKLDEIIKVKV
jgi:DNA polymerase V